MLYKLVDGKNVYDLNPELLAIPEFAKLQSINVPPEDQDRRMKFTIFISDRRSPLRTLPEKDKREKAARIVGCKMEGNRLDRNAREWCDGKNESIEKAVAKYKELQFDENEDLLATINAQIHEIKDYLKSDKTKSKDYGKALEQAAKLGEKLPSLIEAKQKLEGILNIQTEYKPEVTTYSHLDLPVEQEASSERMSTIDEFHEIERKKKDNNQ